MLRQGVNTNPSITIASHDNGTHLPITAHMISTSGNRSHSIPPKHRIRPTSFSIGSAQIYFLNLSDAAIGLCSINGGWIAGDTIV